MECSFRLQCTCFCLEGLSGSPLHFAKLPISAKQELTSVCLFLARGV
jgi:hypothetical protein